MTELPHSTEKSLESILSTGDWYPVLSPLKIHGSEPTTFWVSELSERFLEPLDQGEAACYRVDFIPELHSADGADMSAIGRVATLDPAIRVQLLTVGNYAYIANRDLVEEKNRRASVARQQDMFEKLSSPKSSSGITAIGGDSLYEAGEELLPF